MAGVVGFLVNLVSNPYVAFALLAVAIGWGVHDHGVKQERRKWEARLAAQVAEQKEKRAQYLVEMSARSSALFNALQLERSRIQSETQTIIKEVTRYVTPQADRRCDITRGFVQLHDGSATGNLPPGGRPAGPDVDQSAGVPLSVAGTVIAENYGACRELAAEVGKWREWYPRYKAAYEAYTGRTPGQSQAVPVTKGR